MLPTAIVAFAVACSGGLCVSTTVAGLDSVERCQFIAPIAAGMSRSEPEMQLAERFGAQPQLYFECRSGEDGPVLYSFSTSPLLADRFAAAR